MYFSSKGYAIHGSYELPDYNASHGCIRITPVVAQWLNENYIDVGTTVIILPYN
jgi:lipoprotein-anchoring transpeptidase ErfK/SrfK